MILLMNFHLIKIKVSRLEFLLSKKVAIVTKVREFRSGVRSSVYGGWACSK